MTVARKRKQVLRAVARTHRQIFDLVDRARLERDRHMPSPGTLDLAGWAAVGVLAVAIWVVLEAGR